MEISIIVDGVKIDLTPEQVAKLTKKAEEKKNPFEWGGEQSILLYYFRL